MLRCRLKFGLIARTRERRIFLSRHIYIQCFSFHSNLILCKHKHRDMSFDFVIVYFIQHLDESYCSTCLDNISVFLSPSLSCTLSSSTYSHESRVLCTLHFKPWSSHYVVSEKVSPLSIALPRLPYPLQTLLLAHCAACAPAAIHTALCHLHTGLHVPLSICCAWSLHTLLPY